jgi:hypothetical protein
MGHALVGQQRVLEWASAMWLQANEPQLFQAVESALHGTPRAARHRGQRLLAGPHRLSVLAGVHGQSEVDLHFVDGQLGQMCFEKAFVDPHKGAIFTRARLAGCLWIAGVLCFAPYQDSLQQWVLRRGVEVVLARCCAAAGFSVFTTPSSPEVGGWTLPPGL